MNTTTETDISGLRCHDKLVEGLETAHDINRGGEQPSYPQQENVRATVDRMLKSQTFERFRRPGSAGFPRCLLPIA